MNYPGSGGSDGPARLGAVGPAALGAYDALKQRGNRPVFIQGASFGTTAALCIAARRPVAGLILFNPPPLRQLILGQYGWWNLWLLAGPVAWRIPAELDSLANGAHSAAPAIFVRFGADDIVPPNYQRRVSNAYAGPKRMIDIPGAKHSDPLPREGAQQLADGVEWLWRTSVEGEESRE